MVKELEVQNSPQKNFSIAELETADNNKKAVNRK